MRAQSSAPIATPGAAAETTAPPLHSPTVREIMGAARGTVAAPDEQSLSIVRERRRVAARAKADADKLRYSSALRSHASAKASTKSALKASAKVNSETLDLLVHVAADLNENRKELRSLIQLASTERKVARKERLTYATHAGDVASHADALATAASASSARRGAQIAEITAAEKMAKAER